MTTQAEKAVHTAHQLYNMRRTAISFLGEQKFRESLPPIRHLMKEVQKANNCTDMQAAIKIMETVPTDPFHLVCIAGACVEVMEPSLPQEVPANG